MRAGCRSDRRSVFFVRAFVFPTYGWIYIRAEKYLQPRVGFISVRKYFYNLTEQNRKVAHKNYNLTESKKDSNKTKRTASLRLSVIVMSYSRSKILCISSSDQDKCNCCAYHDDRDHEGVGLLLACSRQSTVVSLCRACVRICVRGRLSRICRC